SMDSQGYTSVMKFTVDGRPYIKDVHDLFGALITQVKFDTHRYLFRNYDNTITSEEALSVLANLQFTRSIKVPDPEDPYRLITTITTTTFNMERSVAKALCQQFLAARLMVNAVDPSNRTFRDRGFWQITPKGLIVLNEFCRQTDKDHYMLRQFPVDGLLLVPLDRYDDDQLCLNRQNMAALFRTMMDGLSVSSTNHKDDTSTSSLSSTTTTSSSSTTTGSHYRSKDDQSQSQSKRRTEKTSYATTKRNSVVSMRQSQNGLPTMSKSKSDSSSSSAKKTRKIFSSQLCCDWLVAFCMLATREEAELVTSEFLRHGWLECQNKDTDVSSITASKGTLLVVTNKGRTLLLTDPSPSSNKSIAPTAASVPTAAPALNLTTPNLGPSLHPLSPSPGASPVPTALKSRLGAAGPADNSSPMLRSFTTRPSSSAMDHAPTQMASRQQQQEGNSARLMIVLNDPQLRSLFKDFLQQNFCAENLDFWIDYTNLRRKCKTQNPALASQSQKDLLEDAYVIWSNYLSPGAKWELNVDNDLQQEMARLVKSMIKFVPGDYAPTMINTSSQSNSQCLRTMLKRFDRVEEQVCRLMASDSVPKFV
ncbi:hypothetical protein DM01DRAFT_249529, partial [Hesseltinella vesiculosa]